MIGILLVVAAAILLRGVQLYRHSAVPESQNQPASGPSPDVRIETHFHDLVIRRAPIPFPTTRGAMASLGDILIVSGRDGELYQLVGNDGATAATLAFKVPIQLSTDLLSKFDRRTLSVLDLAVVRVDQSHRLYASYFDFDGSNASGPCLTINLASIEIKPESAAGGERIIVRVGDWTIHYRTRPCVGIGMLWPGSLFGGGGRIRQFGNDLLLSVGSLGVDGVGVEPAVSQLPEYDYGKVLRLSLDGSRRDVFTIGHRNPQGLAVLASGAVIATEHGPRGGDEINVLEVGSNYGWPFVTYGTNYESRVWPLNKDHGRHEGYRKPLLAFVPSVGISAIVEVLDNVQFPDWRGDLLVATLREQALLRARYEDGRIVYVEPIQIGRRLRAIASLPDGTIALLADSDEVLLVTNAGGKAGADARTIVPGGYGPPGKPGLR